MASRLTMCNCESGFCAHTPGPCRSAAEGNWEMDYVGQVCDSCAGRTVASGGGGLIHPLTARAEREIVAAIEAGELPPSCAP